MRDQPLSLEKLTKGARLRRTLQGGGVPFTKKSADSTPENSHITTLCLPNARRRFFQGCHFGTHQRNQSSTVIVSVLHRIEASDQESGNAKIVICQQGFSHLGGSSDQRRGVAARAGRSSNGSP
jgi:hypothetical protein